MRLKSMTSVLLVLLSLTVLSTVNAQSPSVEWTAWNAQITARSGNTPLDIAETQVIKVLSGTLHAGTRNYSQPVQVQGVYLAVNGGQPSQLSRGSRPGTYSVSNSNGQVIVDYQLPQAASAGDSFAVQINFTVDPATANLIDWYVVPGDHGATVRSSKVTLNFPEGQAPSADFVRIPQGNGTVTASGSSIVIQTQGPLPANQPFEIQVPFGAGVGQPGNGNAPVQNAPVQNAPVQSAPVSPSSDTGGGLGSILPILCVLGLLVLLGGGGLLRGLLGGILGGALGGGNSGGGIFGGRGSSGGGIFGRGGSSSGSSGTTGSSGGRGFRQSANQNREVPTIKNDKDSGGGASFR